VFGLLTSGVTLYWRWLLLLAVVGSVFGAGAAWEGKRAEKRLDAYKAAVEAAADRQAIHAGVVTLEGRKTLETVSGGLNRELETVQSRYDLYRQANPACYDSVAGCVQPAPAKAGERPVPAPAAGLSRDAENSPVSRFVEALRGCEENAAALKAWQQWYLDNQKNFEEHSLPKGVRKNNGRHSRYIIIALLSAFGSFIASYSAVKMKLAYMERDIRRAQETGDKANNRIDAVLGYRAGIGLTIRMRRETNKGIKNPGLL